MKTSKVAIALGLLLILITGCAQAPTGKASSKTARGERGEQEIAIGGILILTGPGASWGRSSLNGAQLAIDEINAQGGVNGKNLRLTADDTGGDPKRAIAAYRKLRDIDGAQFIIGTTWSRDGLPIAPIAAKDDVVMISPSLGVAAFNEQGSNLFNLWPHDAALSAKLADLVFDEGHRNVAVFSAQDPWVKDQTIAFAKRFKELGGAVIIEEPTIEDKTQLTEAMRIRDADVDAVVFTNTITGDIGARRLRELGFDKPMYSITIGADTIAASNGAMDGLRFLSSLTPSVKFRQRYASSYPGEVLDVGGDTAYDAVKLLAQAMDATDSEDPKVIAAYIGGLKTYDGESGTLVFDGKGGVTKAFREFEVRNSTAVPVN
jgi:branched-chain amino acid transport system substrate-binding protein